jgi:AraC-like DNA-binding protein
MNGFARIAETARFYRFSAFFAPAFLFTMGGPKMLAIRPVARGEEDGCCAQSGQPHLHIVAASAPGRQSRYDLGEISLLRYVPSRLPVWGPIGFSSHLLRLIIPTTGRVTIQTHAKRVSVAEGEALLLNVRDDVECGWSRDASGVVIQVAQGAVQAANFDLNGEPRRVANTLYMLSVSEYSVLRDALWPLTADDQASPLNGDAGIEHGALIVKALAYALAQASQRDDIFPIVGSVKRALDQLHGSLHDATPETLARAAGVTLPMLRRNVRATTGVALTHLIQGAQLDWAHARLSSDRESRPVEALARASGLGGARLFARAYQRRFGETPTQTRARVFARG